MLEPPARRTWQGAVEAHALECDRFMTQQIDRESEANPQKPTGDYYSLSLNVIVLIGISAVFIVSVIYRPPDENYFTICGFKTLTGLPCPGCGLTHSFCAIGKGEMLRAIGFNLLGPFLFVLTAMAWVRSVCVLAGRYKLAVLFDAGVARLKLVRNTVIALTLYGVARIVWLLIYPSSDVQNSPLLRLVAWLTG